jgi:hypothetical protein
MKKKKVVKKVTRKPIQKVTSGKKIAKKPMTGATMPFGNKTTGGNTTLPGMGNMQDFMV